MIGDIVKVKRKAIGFLVAYDDYKNKDSTVVDELIARVITYYHFGVQISKDEVAHFVGTSYRTRKNSQIEIIKLKDFSRNGKVEIVNNYKKEFTDKEVVRRAYSKVNTHFGTYSVINNNCEHFATWCITGEKQSTQSYFLIIPIKLKNINKKIILDKISNIKSLKKYLLN